MVPEVQGNQLTLTLSEENQQLPRFLDLIQGVFSAAQDQSGRSERVQSLKLLVLAMHTYHDKYLQFPHAATTSPDGRSRMTWT